MRTVCVGGARGAMIGELRGDSPPELEMAHPGDLL